MNDKKIDYEIKNKNYFVLASIIFLVFILMMTMMDLTYYIRKNKENNNMKTKETFIMMEEEKPDVLNPSCLIVSGEDKTGSIVIIEESLKKAKVEYSLRLKYEDITNNELQSAEIIIVNGSEFGNLGNMDILYRFLKKGKHIIFTSMPSIENNETKKLGKIMGIKNITKPDYQEGAKFLPGFMLGGLLELPELRYKAPKVELLSTTKTYAIGSDNSALIWRNIYDKSEIYVVNGPFFETNAGYGILSAIMAQTYQDYIYPVVNAKVFTYTGFPYISYENTSELEEIYNRDAMKLQHDILIPDILSINKSRNLIPSGFITDNFNKDHMDKINNYTVKEMNNYEEYIYKLGGEVGMVYSGDIEKDIEIYHDLFNDRNFKSIRLNDKNLGDLNEIINKKQFRSIEAVLGPWTEEYENFGRINENTVYIPFTIDGIDNTDLEELEFYSGITAFGAIIQNFNLDQIIFPKEAKDNWMNVSRDYIKLIDSYRSKFQMIEAKNVTETVQSVKKFVTNSTSIVYSDNKIEIKIAKWQGESYYILRTNKEVDSIIEGTIEKIEEGAYLVTAKNKEVEINLKQIDRYE